MQIIWLKAPCSLYYSFTTIALKSSVSQQIAYKIDNRLYLSITDRCTLDCAFCPKNQGDFAVHGYDLRMDHRPQVDEIIAAVGDPTVYDEIVFCGYGEPTLRLKVLLEVARYVKSHGGKVRINTDGLANLVHKDDVLPEMAECIDALSVSMNAQNEAIYVQHCLPNLPGSYQAMLKFLEEARQFIPDVTATAIDGLDGVDIAACEQRARQIGVGFRARHLGKVG